MSADAPSIIERLLAQRIVFLGTEIDDDVANAVIAQLLYLESQDRTRDITLYLNSPGGVVTSALAIHDAMTSIAPPVATVAMGQTAGVAALLLAAGWKGKRSAFLDARIALLPLETPPGKSPPPRELRRLNLVLRDLLSRHTRVDLTTIEAALERGRWMTAEQARDFGIIDDIAERRFDEVS